MTTLTRSTIRTLTGAESDALLRAHTVGRLAFSQHDRVNIEPIHYVYDAPWIFGRTSGGAKLLTLAFNSWCAFEIDEVQGMLEWQSVVVKGQFSPRNSPDVRWNYERALIALRRLVPAAFTDDDPTPQRDVVFGIHALEISGRRSELSAC